MSWVRPIIGTLIVMGAFFGFIVITYCVIDRIIRFFYNRSKEIKK